MHILSMKCTFYTFKRPKFVKPNLTIMIIAIATFIVTETLKFLSE